MKEAKAWQTIAVTTPDGVSINAVRTGNPAGPAIVLVHGFMQSHLSWVRQLGTGEAPSPLTKDFNLIAYDFRGHGASDKPMSPEFYREAPRFADELKAVIEASGVKRPVLAGWSYGTRIITEYVGKHGTGAIAGINYVASAISDSGEHYGPGRVHLGRTFDPDLAVSIRETRAFLRSCFERQPAQDDFETMLLFNGMVPIKVREWLRRPGDYAATLKGLKVPVLITHGREDKITKLALGEWVSAQVPGSRISVYDGIGHAPFFEDAARFNGELAAFVQGCKGDK